MKLGSSIKLAVKLEEYRPLPLAIVIMLSTAFFDQARMSRA